LSVRAVIAAELTWTDRGFAHGLALWIDEDGRIARVGPAAEALQNGASRGE
jgi:hypothetical protein